MKFDLFGKLRDNEEGGQDDQQNFMDDQQSYGDTEINSGGGLERTVENLFNQGYSQDEIRQELSGRYSQQEIKRAINNTVTSNAAGNQQTSGLGSDLDGGPEPMSKYQEDSSSDAVSPMDEGFDDEQEDDKNQQPMNNNMPQNFGQNNQQNNMQAGSPNQQQQPPQPQGQVQQGNQQQNNEGLDPRIEELVETVIAENFRQVETEFENVYSEIDELVEEISNLKNRVNELEVRDDEDQQQFIEKMDEIEGHIDSYDSRIGGLEKAFQQVLPSLVDNVRELTDLVQEMKQEKGIETEANVSEDDIEGMEDW